MKVVSIVESCMKDVYLLYGQRLIFLIWNPNNSLLKLSRVGLSNRAPENWARRLSVCLSVCPTPIGSRTTKARALNSEFYERTWFGTGYRQTKILKILNPNFCGIFKVLNRSYCNRMEHWLFYIVKTLQVHVDNKF